MLDARRIGAPISERIFDDMAERHEGGIKKYGVPLTAGDGRNHLIDALQEAYDLCVYLRQELDERGVDMSDLNTVRVKGSTAILLTHYLASFTMIVGLRKLIDEAEAAK